MPPTQLSDLHQSPPPPPEEARFHSKNRAVFQWGGTICAMEKIVKANFTSSPISLRMPSNQHRQFGLWVAFLAVGIHLPFPQNFPFSQFPLFVIVPDWLANQLRKNALGGILCLVVGLVLIAVEIKGIGGHRGSGFNLHSVACFLCISLSIYFTTFYLSRGSW